MTVELYPAEIALIDEWYHASASESAHDHEQTDWPGVFALIAKLGIQPDGMDIHAASKKGVRP